MVDLRDFITRVRQGFSLRRLLPFALVALGVLAILLAAPPVWEYSNSPTFCGLTCHTMPPEYSTYLISPHSRVPCVDCHIGRDLLLVQFFRKAGHMRLLVDTVLENYELPIRSAEMRPARETCELCHTPEKFSDDSLRVIETFENNRTNDPYDIYLLMHTGGGSEREGLGRGIHWHIENEISYIALDPEEQEIPWVRVETPDGQVTEYNAINSPIDTENIDQYEIHEMDCITCHNRISHFLQPPNRAVDEALSQEDISTDIPFIRTRSVELLSASYTSTEQALQTFESLDEYYRDNYPDFYAEGQQKVQDAISVLKALYTDSNYPEQLLTWNTHPNNVGHRDSPGCFRCHDGEHFSTDGQVVRLECNLCHSIPKVVRPGEIEPMLALTTGIEPSSHLDSTWISRHHTAFDQSCSNCHTTTNPGGVDDQSFCSNSACHGSAWTYAGFDAPGLASVLGIYQVSAEPLLEDFEGDPTYTVLQPLFTQECGGCHGPVPSKGLRLTDYESLLAGSESGPVVVAGSPDESKMIQVLTSGHFAQPTEHQMDLIRQWIANGLPE
ncbi:MAG: NapC/NirT family cytochrome c [Anaerolineae bacterium]|nr:NapC/NirT family cytochrome c [Anaerolineae bacterium]